MLEFSFMQNLFILGIKHSGKTTFARLLANRLNVPSIDSDDLVLDVISPLTVRDYYKEFGKVSFQEKEIETVRAYIESQEKPFIMSMGGGAADNLGLIEVMKSNGLLIYLKRPECEMLPVILKHGLPAFLDPDDVEGSFRAMYERRNSIYEEIADKTVDMGSYRDRRETLKSLIEQLGGIIG